MAAITAATAAAGTLAALAAKKQFIDKPAKAERQLGYAQADAAAKKAEADKQAAAKLAEDEKKAAADASAKQLLETQQAARGASLQDFLMGEGDTNQRRKFLRGAK